MEQAVKDKKAVAAKKRKDTRLRRERARLDEIAALTNAKHDGRAEGKAEGITEGIAQGIAEGRAKFLKKAVLNMHEAGYSIADIVKVSELSENEVENILNT